MRNIQKGSQEAGSDKNRKKNDNAWQNYNLIIAFAEKFKFLVLHVHENSIKVPCLGRSNLNSFAAPSKYLSGTDIRYRKQTSSEVNTDITVLILSSFTCSTVQLNTSVKSAGFKINSPQSLGYRLQP